MIPYTGELVESLSLGVIQTTLDHKKAWQHSVEPRMSIAQDN